MNDDGPLSLGCLFMALLVLFVCGSIYFWAKGGYEGGYKQGQIDAIQGNVKYELRDQPDGSRVWVETERGK